MAVTTTAQLNLTVKQVVADYPELSFETAPIARWSAADNTVYFRDVETFTDLYSLFHELGHGVLTHQTYEQDIELLRIENEAWQEAQSISVSYGYTIDENMIEEALDGYRQWLHARSRCPTCTNPGIQHKKSGLYSCILCNTSWHTNDARQCGLKRYTKK